MNFIFEISRIDCITFKLHEIILEKHTVLGLRDTCFLPNTGVSASDSSARGPEFDT